eukprot:2617223-Prymnesium_polylepis.1
MPSARVRLARREQAWRERRWKVWAWGTLRSRWCGGAAGTSTGLAGQGMGRWQSGGTRAGRKGQVERWLMANASARRTL